MAVAQRDDNRIPTLIGVSSADLTTPTLLVVDSTSGALYVDVQNTSLAVTGTFWQTTQPVSIAQDIMLGTDFSNVFGSASIVSATPAVKVEEQNTLTIQATNLDIRDLSNTQDNILIYANTAKDGSGTNYVPLVDSDGKLVVNVQNFAIGTYGDSDNVASNLTSGLTFAEMFVFDGTNWDRLRGDSTNGAFVNLKASDLDLMLGTDFSNVFGTASVISATPAVKVEEQGTITVDSELTTDDLDTGAGTDTRAVVGLIGSASGGGQLIPGSATDGLLVNLGANNDVTASQSGTWNINNISGTVSLPTGAATEATLAAIDAGKLEEATFTGRIGEVQASPTANTVLARLKTIADQQLADSHNVTVDNAAGSGVYIRPGTGVNLDTSAVAITSALPTGSNAIGKLAANSGVDIGDVDVTSLAHGKTIKSKGGTAASSGNNTLVAAVAAKKLKVHAFSLTTTSTTAVTCIFQSGAGGTELWRVVLQAPSSTSTGANLAVPVPAHLFETAANTLLNLNLSAAQTIHYSVSYIEEA